FLVVGRKGNVGSVFISNEDFWPIDTAYFVRETPCAGIRFLYYLLQSLRLERLDRSTAIPGLNRDDAYDLPVLLPPLAEQQRIVERIETLFAELDKGEESLRQVQTLLARYRQSVLKAAVTGELTADWRDERAGKLEHGRDLLERILQTRRETWEGRGKYKEPSEPDPNNLPELPDSWTWATVDQLSVSVDYGTSARCSENASGTPVLRMGNIVDGALDPSNLKYLPSDHADFPKLLLRSGDLLFNRTNSAELVGKTAVYQGVPQPCSFASYLIRARLIEVSPDFVSAFINSVYGRAWVRSVVSQQVGQANVNGSKLKALAVPLPPLIEQEEIVSRMNEALSLATSAEKACQDGLSRSAALRQSVLKDAFSGRLIPQDPSDEPASELLARIHRSQEAGRAAKR
ncbi:MAG: hypothetical protein GX761_10575, partial [Gammaproteobacteria bacterium]|nr:hypothetical protein [Gammaproteobacteria bacterium]